MGKRAERVLHGLGDLEKLTILKDQFVPFPFQTLQSGFRLDLNLFPSSIDSFRFGFHEFDSLFYSAGEVSGNSSDDTDH